MIIYTYDPDYRKEPKTDNFCCHCQKDIKNIEKSSIKVWIDLDSFRLSFEKPQVKAYNRDGWLEALLGKTCKKHLEINNRILD